jgi:hypothetical protein
MSRVGSMAFKAAKTGLGFFKYGRSMFLFA